MIHPSFVHPRRGIGKWPVLAERTQIWIWGAATHVRTDWRVRARYIALCRANLSERGCLILSGFIVGTKTIKKRENALRSRLPLLPNCAASVSAHVRTVGQYSCKFRDGWQFFFHLKLCFLIVCYSQNTSRLTLEWCMVMILLYMTPPEGGDFEDLALSGPYGLLKLKIPGWSHLWGKTACPLHHQTRYQVP